jgi:alcohol dehydrogenase
MRALYLDTSPKLLTDYPRPERRSGEARIRLALAGVCDTDLQLARGYMNYRGVLGHEFVGEVVEAEDARWLGKRVVGDINAGCGVCEDCVERAGHHCPKRSVLGIQGRDGALADELVLPERCLVEVPDSVPNERAVFAEPLAAALHVLDDLGARQRICVLGDGKLGLLIALSLANRGKNPLCVGHHREKLSRLESAGIRVALESEVQGESAEFDCVIDATGSAGGLARAFQLLEPRGLLILKTTVVSQGELNLSPVVINELEVRGSRCGDLASAIAAMQPSGLDPSVLISERFPLDDAEQALTRAAEKGVLKVVVDPTL